MGRAREFNDLFCIPAFFVLFRETLEAAVLVAVILQYLDRAKQPQIKRKVWLGAFVGGLISLALGATVLAVYYTQKKKFNSTTAFVVEGSMLGFASIVISYFLITHLAPGMKKKGTWETKWERNMGQMVTEELEGRRKHGFFILSFTSVLREGFEAAIFVVGIGAAYTFTSMPLAIGLGILGGVACGVFMFWGSKELDLSNFFRVSAIFLALIAAGLASHASYEFQKGECFGAWSCKKNCDTESVEGPGYELVAGYLPVSDVEPHALIDRDVRALSNQAFDGDFDGAWATYAEGGNSAKGDGFRTVRGFALKDLSGEATYDTFAAYYDSLTYADDYVRSALWNSVGDDSPVKAAPEPDAGGHMRQIFENVAESDDMAAQAFVKGAQYMATWIYATHELYSAVAKCEARNLDDETGAPHAWDEGWAFYAGSSVGTDGKGSGYLTYTMAYKRCGAAKTCRGSDAYGAAGSWRDNGFADEDEEGAIADASNSDVNAKLLRLFRAGQVAVGSGQCSRAEQYVEKIVSVMSVPSIQGALKYAYYSDPEGGDAVRGGGGAQIAEFNAFAHAVLPLVADCDADAAATIARNAALPASLEDDAVDGLVPDGYLAVKAAFEAAYACMGVSCADVGGLDDVFGPCDFDGSSRDDEAAFYDDLEQISGPIVDPNEEEECEDDEIDSWHTYRRLNDVREDGPPGAWYDALSQQAPSASQARRRLWTGRMHSCDGKGQSIAWVNREVWDITGCCDTSNGFFFLMMVLFWYRPAMTRLELIIWFIYWIVAFGYAYWKVQQITYFNEGLEAEAALNEEKKLAKLSNASDNDDILEKTLQEEKASP